MTPETMALQLAVQDPYLQKESLLGENLEERLERFGVIVENAYGDWDLSDRDENALRTANAMLVKQKAELEVGRAALRERDAAWAKAVLGLPERNQGIFGYCGGGCPACAPLCALLEEAGS